MTEKKPRSTGNKTSPSAIDNALRDAEAVKLRSEGKTFDEIAVALEFDSRASAFNAVKRRLGEVKAEAVDDLRKVENARIERGFKEVFRVINNDIDFSTLPDDMAGPVFIQAVAGVVSADQEMKLKALDRLDKLSKTYQRLNGLEMPVKVEQTGASAFPIYVNPDLLPDGMKPPAHGDD